LDATEPDRPMKTTIDLDAVIARYSPFAFDESTPLPAAGIESLAMLRLAVEVAANGEMEIDASALAGLRTVGDLKRWLSALASGTRASTPAS
jgi:hypothetical protein